jgi:polysaccharide export outer membrane protein
MNAAPLLTTYCCPLTFAGHPPSAATGPFPNSQLSTLNSQLSTAPRPLTTARFQLAPFRFLLSAFCFLFSACRFQHFSMSSVLRPFSGFRFQVSGFIFLLSAFCFLLLNAASAQPKFAELPAWVQSATNALPATPTTVSNAPSNAASQVSQTATNLSPLTSTNSMDALDDLHKLAIGDRLSYRIVEDEEDPKPIFVTDSGDLEVPLLGRFPSVNKTCKQLARDLKTELEKEYYFHATVIVAVDVMTKSRGKVYLVGPVRAPGPQEIPSDEVLTLSKAILRAGGFGDYAEKHKVRVTRKSGAAAGQDKVFTVDVAAILEQGKTESDLPLEPGDLIYVPERLIRF